MELKNDASAESLAGYDVFATDEIPKMIEKLKQTAEDRISWGDFKKIVSDVKRSKPMFADLLLEILDPQFMLPQHDDDERFGSPKFLEAEFISGNPLTNPS